MNRIVKGAAALACVSFLSFPARAENYVIPFDNNGNIPAEIELVGADVFVDTGLAAIGSTTPVMLYGYSVSSDAVSNYAMLRDTSTLNLTSNIKLLLYPDSYATSAAQTTTSRLPMPVIFRNGLSINLNSVVVGATGTTKGRWMFYVRYLREGGVPDKSPSQIDPRISVDNVGVN